MNSAIWGFIGTLIGAGVTIAVSFIAVWKENKLQEKSYIFEREEKARAFQRENLLKIQDLLQKSVRLMARAHQADVSAYKETGTWRKNKLEDEINDAITENNRELVVTIERIANDDLRKDIKDLRGIISSGIVLAKSDKESESILHEATDSFLKLMENVGAELRKNY